MGRISPAYRISESTDPEVWRFSNWDAMEIVADSNGYRLPTEAQWEYAAKGGDGSPGNYTYSGSNNADDVAWYGDNSNSMTHEVGKKAPNGLGLYDMSGNVDEWCLDYYVQDSYTSDNIRRWYKDNKECRVARGGGWLLSAKYVRSACRVSDNYMHEGYYDVGFRLVRP